MGQEETSGPLRGKRAHKLPLELAELLTPSVEHGLNHPLRREILRALNACDEPRSAGELVTRSLPKTGVTLISYHASVLEGCDVLRVSEVVPGEESFFRRYSSNVVDDPQIVAILVATESLDRLAG